MPQPPFPKSGFRKGVPYKRGALGFGRIAAPVHSGGAPYAPEVRNHPSEMTFCKLAAPTLDKQKKYGVRNTLRYTKTNTNNYMYDIVIPTILRLCFGID